MKALLSDILRHAFLPHQNTEQLRDEILRQQYFYLAMRESVPFLISKYTLPVLLQEGDANIYVCKTATGFDVQTMSKNELLELISDLQELREVRFYSSVPIYISFAPRELTEELPKSTPEPPERLPIHAAEPETPEPNPELSLEPGAEPFDSKAGAQALENELDLTLQMDEGDPEPIPIPSMPEIDDPVPNLNMDSELNFDDAELESPSPESAPKELPGSNPEPDEPAPVEQPSEPAAESNDSSHQFIGVDKVKEYFSLFDNAARSKIDPGHRFTNIRTLVETLYQQNGLNTSDIDAALGFTNNFTSNFINAASGESVKKAVVLKYLKFFGLEEYWLFYQDCCMEIKREIINSPELNQQKIKYPAKPYAEKFRLTEIREGKYEGAILYQVTLVGESETVKLFVTNPVKPVLKVGNLYQLLNRDGEERAEDTKRKTSISIDVPSQDEIEAVMRKIEGKGTGAPSERSFEQVRKDKIIFYLKDRLHLPLPSAENKFKEFESDSDILNEFYEFIINKKFGKLEIQGYTARRLIKELKRTPYDAFHDLLELRNSPGEAKQKLKLIEGSLKAEKQRAESKEKPKK